MPRKNASSRAKCDSAGHCSQDTEVRELQVPGQPGL